MSENTAAERDERPRDQRELDREDRETDRLRDQREEPFFGCKTQREMRFLICVCDEQGESSLR